MENDAELQGVCAVRAVAQEDVTLSPRYVCDSDALRPHAIPFVYGRKKRTQRMGTVNTKCEREMQSEKPMFGTSYRADPNWPIIS